MWKDIPGYEYYQANTKWDIKSLSRKYSRIERILKQDKRQNWYMQVCIHWKTVKVHRLVMLAFNWKSELEVNHKNWIKHDNRLENLEYVTKSENHIHRFKELWHKWNWLWKVWPRSKKYHLIWKDKWYPTDKK